MLSQRFFHEVECFGIRSLILPRATQPFFSSLSKKSRTAVS